jgi:hypothetical protein
MTRRDRADKDWHTYLEYDTQREKKIHNAVDFDKALDRKDNEVHSKYPIRLSLSKPLKVHD